MSISSASPTIPTNGRLPFLCVWCYVVVLSPLAWRVGLIVAHLLMTAFVMHSVLSGMR